MMTNKNKGLVVLVGAGPGDMGLLTLSGKQWLQKADVVLYDHLVNPDMIRFTQKSAEMIYVGKKEGVASMEQEQINNLLINKAREEKIVVRLKGGDPFIFGRGGEEIQAIQAVGIPFIIVPGVTSVTGVAAYAGIPLTHRHLSSTLSIITGSNEKNQGDIHIDWEKIASRSGTLVFLMGARKLPLIVEKLIKFGKSPDTPIAVVQWGTTARQKTWTGTLGTIVEISAEDKILPPALTIIGEVVNLKSKIEWYEHLPLFGKTVVVTRKGDQADSMIDRLRELGAEPFFFPVIETIAPDDWSPLDNALNNLSQYDGLIFTSVNGVRFFAERLKTIEQDIRELKGARVYTIGPKTAEAVRDLGIRVDVVPENFIAESLIESIGNAEGKRFLIPRATVARETLPEQLRKMGALVDVAPAYKTVLPSQSVDALEKRLKEGSVDVITFTSSSTVTNFLTLTGEQLLPAIKNTKIACIGPITAKTARDAGLNVEIMPEQYTVSSLMDAIEIFYQ
ncbi:MAG: uroporphyrinogen-III C-methyltransferase [Nitrospina sp.]|nr:uroporphyrinogen-III C-methyltransferase [Nitrospina sp.]MBT7681269.1 uroporphyrinogen-III C-methyltransferase [Nitrospina sp.]MBT7708582.1 uroporphyrinogen-III C-methyltransferase [Nitrospina sp.]